MRSSFYILDGHALSYQAFYAVTGLHSPEGIPTNAVFGFIHSLQRMFKSYAPDYLAICFDMRAKTFRHESFEEYKANRKPMPVALQSQILLIQEWLNIMQIPIFAMDGYEGDDLIATLAHRALGLDVEIYLVSPDKDMAQLLNDRIHLIDSKHDSPIGVQTILDKYHIPPERLPDYFGLVGDSTDNIPGVPGIGPKRASKLLQQWPTLEILYEQLANVEPLATRQNLEQNREAAFLSKSLFQVNTQVPIEFNLEQCRIRTPDRTKLIEFYQKLGFRSFLSALLKSSSTTNTMELFPEDSQESLEPIANTAIPADSGVVNPPEPAVIPADTRIVKNTEPVARTPVANTSAIARSPAITALPPLIISGADASTAIVPKLSAMMDDSQNRSVLSVWLIQNHHEIEELVSLLKLQPEIVIECDCLISGFSIQLQGLALGWDLGKAAYIPSNIIGKDQWDLLRQILSIGPKKIGHHLKTAVKVLSRQSMDLAPLGFDTMLAAYLLSAGSKEYSLDDLCTQFLACNAPTPIASISDGFAEFEDAAPPQIGYFSEVLQRIAELHKKLLPNLQEKNLVELLENLELPLIPILVEMEENGITIDQAVLQESAIELQSQVAFLETEIFKLSDEKFNIASSQQLAVILFDKLKLPPGKKIKKGYSTNAEVLENLAPLHPLPSLVLQYRQATKLLNTYVEVLPSLIHANTGRIYTTFHQTGTATGRLSSSDPNLQNIPIRSEHGEKIRRAFVAAPGYCLVTADYSQMELRILAHFSQDTVLIQAFQQDKDIHATVAASLFGVDVEAVKPEQRRIAKTVNFGIIYGQTPFGLSQELRISMEEARRFIDEYFAKLSRVKEYMEEVLALTRQTHYVTTIANRRRYIYDINASNPSAQKLAERMAFNTIMQGSAADITKIAMIYIVQERAKQKLPFRILLQIHDELVVETPQAIASDVGHLLGEQMKRAGSMLSVPVKISINSGQNWQEAHG